MTNPVLSQAFSDVPQAPGDARHWLEGALAELGYTDFHDELMLLVSELVTNAIRYTGDAVGVTVYVHATGIWVSVADDGAGRVELRHADVTDVSGRGIELVDKLSTNWGVIAERAGKSVWFEMSDTQPAPLSGHPPASD